jgi:hypothetical protein
MHAVAKKPTKAKPDEQPLPQVNAEEDWITRSVRFPPELYERIGIEAGESRRSTQLHVIWMLEEFYRLKAEVERLRGQANHSAE